MSKQAKEGNAALENNLSETVSGEEVFPRWGCGPVWGRVKTEVM